MIARGRLAVFTCQKSMTCNRSVVVMESVSWRGENPEVTKPMAITQLKMEDAYILCNVIKKNYEEK